MAKTIEPTGKDNTKIKLRVAEALPDDAYKGIVRIDSETMKRIGVNRGDAVLIKGSKETVAIVDRAYPADMGEGIVRLDGIIRKNAKTGIGEFVDISKADVKEAKKIIIAPVEQNVVIQGDKNALLGSFLGKVFMKGDILSIGGGTQRGRRRTSRGDEFGDFGDMFNDLFEEMGMGNIPNLGGNLSQIRFVVTSISPNDKCIITENTELVFRTEAASIPEGGGTAPTVTYEDIGGLKEEIKKIREMVELPLKHPEIFEKLGIEPPKGVLLYGPPGTGKTLLAKAVANESQANFVELNSAKVTSALHGQTQKNIKQLFEEAEKNAPSIIFIDELDSIAFKREERGVNEFLNEGVMELLKNLDGLKGRKNVIVIGATNRPEAIDSALRRPGRFDREIEIGVPDKEGRLTILKIHARTMPLTKDVNLNEIADITHGFVGADLAALCKEAAISVIRRVYPDIDWKKDEPLKKEILDKLEVTHKDFRDAMRFVSPSAMREILVETPDIKWADIGGLNKVKQELKESIEIPLKFPKSFERMGIKPPKGVLLYGPPGTGKTLLAKAVANESEANFISLKGSEIISKWVGESAKAITRIFDKAKQVAPCVIFFDEIDAIASARYLSEHSNESSSVINQLLVEMDGLEVLENVTVIAATNRPDMLDPALMRPGRFDRKINIPLPDLTARIIILKIHTKNMPLDKEIDLDEIAERTEGYTGADIESLCREAGILALRRDMESKKVLEKDFEGALEKVGLSVTKEANERYQQMEKSFFRKVGAGIGDNKSYMG